MEIDGSTNLRGRGGEKERFVLMEKGREEGAG